MNRRIVLFLSLLSMLICVDRGLPGVLQEDVIQVSVMDISGDWQAGGDLPWQALMLGLQGVVNRDGPRIYLVYPDDYEHPNVKAVLEYYRARHNVKTSMMESPEDALREFSHYLEGYVVWDPEVVPSLMVSFTVAGLEDALIVTEAYIPLAEKFGLKPVADFRNIFRGKSDAEIFQWAYDEYWDRCSRDYLVYLGEWCKLDGKPGMVPGIADFGVVHRTFFSDLSASPADPEEYRLADRIMSEMNTYAYVFGWHSYCKDQEAEHLTMVSRNSLVIAEGVATLPNMSFHGNMPATPGFEFKQRATFDPDPRIEEKVYLLLIQSDGLGLGSWLAPGRGEIPYGWETNMEWIDLAPALLQYYYEEATPNDHFIGSLSGPGYFYPKAYPVDRLPGALRIADTLMQRLDLHAFGIMDYVEGNRKVGNVDLPKYIVDIYYENMPHVSGFLNGYGPGNTYDWREGRPFISYNYYVDIQKGAEEVMLDLKELARLNPKRPYYLAIHVRQNNDVQRMSRIVEGLGPEFEVVPPREFMIMAGEKPTMTTRYLDYRPNFSGHWKLDAKASKNIFPTSFFLDVDQRGNIITLTTTALYYRFIHHRELKTTKTLVIGGEPVASLEERTRRMGHQAAWSDSISTRARWDEDGKRLIFVTDVTLETSQGTIPVSSRSTFRLADGGMTLIVEEWRSSRDGEDPATIFVYRKVL
ncbi:MAG: GxGYxYP domain-containing protein [Bacteroidota bacterium]